MRQAASIIHLSGSKVFHALHTDVTNGRLCDNKT